MFFNLLGSIFLGWSLGANDSSNIFGTAVSSKAIRYGFAIILASFFVILGAVLQGHGGFETLGSLTTQTISTAFITTLAAALTVTIMTFFKMPISTSQAVVGAILGIGILQNSINYQGFTKVIFCWIGTPIGGMLFSVILYYALLKILRLLNLTLLQCDAVLRYGLILAGCYGAYALGANNVANVTGVYAGNLLTPLQASLIGGFSIAFGIITYSKNVMTTVGRSIVKLDVFSALITVIAHSITVHIYAMIGVPVSSSQAIVGAVFAIGLIKGIQTIHFKMVAKIGLAWVSTPFISMGVAMLIYFVINLKFVG